MRLAILVILSSLRAYSATASLPITFTANTLAVTDIQAYLIKQVQANSALASPMGAGDTSLTLNAIPTLVPTSGSLLIESEVVTYTGISGNMLTGLTRGTTLTNAANNTTATTHSSGVNVSFLQFANVTAWIKNIVLTTVQAAILSLGTGSAYIGTAETTIQTNQATVTTNLGTAVQ